MSQSCLKNLLVQRVRTLAWTYCRADVVDCVTFDKSWLVCCHFKGFLGGVQPWTDLSWEWVSCPYSAVPVTIAASSAEDSTRGGSVWSLLWFPPDLRGSGCSHSSGTATKRVHCSLTAHCSQEAILCPLGDFCMCTDCSPDLIMAQAIFEPSLRSKREKNKTRHIFISFFFFP